MLMPEGISQRNSMSHTEECLEKQAFFILIESQQGLLGEEVLEQGNARNTGIPRTRIKEYNSYGKAGYKNGRPTDTG